MLDLRILDEAGTPVRPWLTTVVDDYSRAVAGTLVFLGAPSTLTTSLALRQAIWRKADPSWPVCGIPDVLYVEYVPRHIFDNMCPFVLCGLVDA
jgi:putative transposase